MKKQYVLYGLLFMLVIFTGTKMNNIRKLNRKMYKTAEKKDREETKQEIENFDTQEETLFAEDEEIAIDFGNLDSDMIHLVDFADEFYEKNFEYTRIISKDGFLYNKSAEEKITPNLLIERYDNEKNLEPKITQYHAELLLLRPSDVDFFKEDSDDDFKIYALVKIGPNEFKLCNEDQAVVKSLSEIQKLLDNYKQDHGKPKFIQKTDPSYEMVYRALQKENDTNDFFIRYLKGDEKYVCVVASPIDDPVQISQYIFEKTPKEFDCVLKNLENENRMFVNVNKKIPDFNLELLPNYTLATEKDFMIKNFDSIKEELIRKKAISDESDQIYFASGTDHYFYVKFTSGLDFFGENEDGVWNIQKVDQLEEIKKYVMEKSGKNAPMFIFLQDDASIEL